MLEKVDEISVTARRSLRNSLSSLQCWSFLCVMCPTSTGNYTALTCNVSYVWYVRRLLGILPEPICLVYIWLDLLIV